MKQNTLRACSAFVKFASIATGLAAYTSMIPEKWGGIAILAFAVVSATKDYAIRIGDVADDGKANNSFKP